MALPLIERRRLLEGDWHVTVAGNVFRREWFITTEQVPDGLRVVRYWDLASSTKTWADYTAGALVGTTRDGRWFVLDIIRGKWQWPDARRVIIQTAHMDGINVPVVVEQVGHQLASYHDLLRHPELSAHSVNKHIPQGDKLNRAFAWSPKIEGGTMQLKRGHWNHTFVNECVGFTGLDDTTHDDMVDAVSGAVQFMALTPQMDYGFFLVLADSVVKAKRGKID